MCMYKMHAIPVQQGPLGRQVYIRRAQAHRLPWCLLWLIASLASPDSARWRLNTPGVRSRRYCDT